MSGGGAGASAGGGGLPEPQELLGQAERVVEKAVAAGADDAEVYWSASESLDLEIAAGRLSATSTGRDAGAGLRVLVGGRLGFAYFTRQQDAGAAIDAALSRARLAPKLDYALPDGGRVEPLPGRFDADVAALDVDRAVR
ncbi:MAG: PmbA/TldA family metallopeptidase, partial [Thermoplasmatota archaeon]